VFGSSLLPGLSLPVLAKSSGYAVRCAGMPPGRKFDVVIAWLLDWLGRSLRDLVGLLSDLHALRECSCISGGWTP
jgi:hypothetical protein